MIKVRNTFSRDFPMEIPLTTLTSPLSANTNKIRYSIGIIIVIKCVGLLLYFNSSIYYVRKNVYYGYMDRRKLLWLERKIVWIERKLVCVE